MNDTVETTIELVDAEGNVTLVPATITSGNDSDGETAPAETAFIAEDSEYRAVGYNA